MKPHEKIYPVGSSRALQTLADDELYPKYKILFKKIKNRFFIFFQKCQKWVPAYFLGYPDQFYA